MKLHILGKYFDWHNGVLMALVFNLGMVYVIPYNLAAK